MPDYAARRTMMVDTQVRPSDVTKFPIIDTLLTVPRELFVPQARREAAYIGENIDLGGGRVVLEPRTLAKMLDALDIQPTELVLDVGPNYGYSSAVLSRMAEAVVAVEEDESFADEAEAALSEVSADNVILLRGPMAEGAAKHGPYDVIMIQGAVEEVPETLTAQLKDGGRIAALFMEGALGVCRIGYFVDGAVSWRFSFNAGAPVLPGFAKRSEFEF
ncbi:MAG: protein-L-isoaspartate O-methyltransferase [Pseudomonadota bacterium]